MLRNSAAAVILISCFTATAWAQAPSTTGPAASPPSKPATKKAAPKAKAAAKQPVAETGPCRLGVISALGDRFSVHKFGLTIFENEESEAPIDGWGLDDLPLARVRAATGADPSVRRIAYPKGAFEPHYNPKSRFLPDPSEGLPAIVRNITSNANCERYLVITKYNAVVSGTKMEIKGIGAYSQGIGSFARHYHLFANVAINMYDGTSYERISRTLAALGATFAGGLGLTEDPLTKLDEQLFPNPPESASSSAALKERTRALVSARLDRMIPVYLQP
ncbi:hypothetical protein CQ14_12085 [Bradyrhizobium lablabi]|uniref:Uncharacterized protein n=1 Tax=Bradyrhizobium lablabi TaxID=722472 RepID=A0A0R3MCJ4_9BRAD|nr:hypothetical protein [Bradyrhizobium lablabi]KRR17134.1 hypothetical protein CQ14_12085 [Bradyrhizobium lablabi]